jgi:hypothetical protein
MITQERLKECLEYDPLTGVFTRKGEKVGTDDGRGYLKASVDNKLYYLHRLAWLYVHGVLPEYTDHIDGNKSNNRISNLRNVSNSANLHNRGAPKNSSTGVKGVCFFRGKYHAYKTINLKRHHLGVFSTEEEAAACVRRFEISHGLNKLVEQEDTL